jgi:hypothetical protein
MKNFKLLIAIYDLHELSYFVIIFLFPSKREFSWCICFVA